MTVAFFASFIKCLDTYLIVLCLQNIRVICFPLVFIVGSNVTRRHGEDGELLKQSNGSHGGTVGA